MKAKPLDIEDEAPEFRGPARNIIPTAVLRAPDDVLLEQRVVELDMLALEVEVCFYDIHRFLKTLGMEERRAEFDVEEGAPRRFIGVQLRHRLQKCGKPLCVEAVSAGHAAVGQYGAFFSAVGGGPRFPGEQNMGRDAVQGDIVPTAPRVPVFRRFGEVCVKKRFEILESLDLSRPQSIPLFRYGIEAVENGELQDLEQVQEPSGQPGLRDRRHRRFGTPDDCVVPGFLQGVAELEHVRNQDLVVEQRGKPRPVGHDLHDVPEKIIRTAVIPTRGEGRLREPQLGGRLEAEVRQIVHRPGETE